MALSRTTALLRTAIILLLGAPPAAAQSAAQAEQDSRPAVQAGASATFVSGYVWRGFTVEDGLCVQPTFWVRLHEVTVSSFVNLSRHDRPGHVLNEHDLTVEYVRTVKGTDLAAGWVHYYFRDAESGKYSNEIYLRAGWEGVLAPSITVAQDVHQGSGTYVNAAVSHAWRLGADGPELEAAAALGYNHHQWSDVSGWSDATFTVKTSWAPSRGMTLEPFATYSWSLDPEIGPSRLYGGLTITAF